MTGRTHREGGRTSALISGIILFMISPIKNNIIYNLILLILIVLVNDFASTMADLDHGEDSLPTKGLISYCIHGVVTKLDPDHRSVATHCITVPVVLYLVPALIIMKMRYEIGTSPIEVNYMLFSILISLFSGNLAHLILDNLTVAGTYSPLAIVRLIVFKIKHRGDSKAYFNKKKYVKNLVLKTHGWMIYYKFPFIKKMKVDDYGKTGGQYEKLMMSNVEVFNSYLIVLLIVALSQPDLVRLVSVIKRLF